MRLDRAEVHVAAGGAARQCQDVQNVVVGVVLAQRAAAADLDVIGMGADRQHALLLAKSALVRGGGEQPDLFDELGGRIRPPEHQAVDAAFDRLAQELRVLVVGGDQRGGPAVTVLDVLEERKTTGSDRRIERQEVEATGRQHAGCGFGVRRDLQRDGAVRVERLPQRASDGFLGGDNQYAQRP